MDSITLDNLGRNLGPVISSLQALQSALASATTSASSNVGGDRKASEELTNLMTQFIKDHEKSVKDNTDLLKQIVDAMKSGKEQRSAPPSSGEGKKTSKDKPPQGRRGGNKRSDDSPDLLGDKIIQKMSAGMKEYRMQINKSFDIMLEKGELVKYQIRDLNQIKNLSEEQQKNLASELETHTKRQLSLEGERAALSRLEEQLRRIDSYTGYINEKFGIQTDVTKGLVKEEANFTKEIRAAAYETAGVTKGSRALQRAYEDIGNTVKETGVDRSEFQKSYMSAIKGGMKDLKQATSITKTQLATEKQLGIEAGGLQENFQNMAMSGKMTNNQIDEVGRGMRDVAKSTGLTGNALKGAVESSSEMIQNLRNAATLTATATRNIIELNANAKKLGVASQMQSLQSNLTSSSKLILESSSETKNLIFLAANKVGKIDKALNGTLLNTQEGLRSFAQGMEGVLKDFGVESVESIDQLSDEAKKTLNLRLKTTVGMELGEFRNLLEATKESGKGLGERLNDINKKMNQNITMEEKKGLLEQQRQMKASKQLQILTALDESAKGAKDMGQALEKFSEKRGEFEKDLEALGTSWQSSTQVARDSLKGALESVNKGLKEAGKSEIKIDASEIEKAVSDPTLLRELTAKISEGEKRLATAQKAQLDPVTQSNQFLSEINDNIRNMSQNVISKGFSSLIGQVGVAASVLTTLSSNAIGFGLESKQLIDSITGIAGGGKDEYSGKAYKSIFENLKTVIFGKKPETKPSTESGATTPTPPKPEKETAPQQPATLPTPTPPPQPVVAEAKLQSVVDETKNQTTSFSSELAKLNTTLTTEIAKVTGILSQSNAALELIMNCCDATQKMLSAKLESLISNINKVSSSPSDASLSNAIAGIEKTMSNVLASSELLVECCDRTANLLKTELGHLVSGMVDLIGISDLILKEMQKQKTAPVAAVEDKGLKNAQLQNVTDDKDLNDAQRKEQKKEIKNNKIEDKNTKRETKLLTTEIKEQKSDAVKVPSPPDGGGFDIQGLLQSGQKYKEAAIAIGALALGVLALGTAIVYLGDNLLKMTGLSIGRVMEIAGIVIAVIGVAAAIIGAGKLAFDQLKEMEPQIKDIEKNYKSVAKTAGILALIGIGMVALGAGIVFISGKILSLLGLDVNKIMEIAGAVAALAAVATAIIVAGACAFSELQKHEDKVANITSNYGKVAKTAAVLGLVGLGMVLIGAVIVFVAGKILSFLGLDVNKIMEIAGAVAALAAVATAIIVAGACAFQAILDNQDKVAFIISNYGTAIGTAAVLSVAGLAMVALGAGIIFFAGKIISYLGLDMQKTIELAGVIAALAGVSAAIITAAVCAFEALADVDLKTIWAGLPKAGLAALVLVPLGLVMVTLGAAIIWLAQKILGAFNLDYATVMEVGFTVAAILGAVAAIAGAVSLAMLGLFALGTIFQFITGPQFWIALGYMTLGAVAITVLTPVMLYLASSLLIFIRDFMAANTLDSASAIQVAQDVGALLGSAALIITGVAASLGVLAGVGAAFAYLGVYSVIVVGLAILGAFALRLLTPAIIELAGSIIYLAEKTLGSAPDPKSASQTADAVASIIGSAATIVERCMYSFSALALIGASILYIIAALPFVWIGANTVQLMVPAMLALALSIALMGSIFSKLIDVKSMENTAKIIDALSGILTKIPAMMTTLAETMAVMFEGYWWQTTPAKTINTYGTMFVTWFTSVAELIKYGIVDPVNEVFPKSSIVAKAGRTMEAMEKTISAVPPVIRAVAEAVGMMAGGLITSTPADTIARYSDGFQKWFTSVAVLIRDGIVTPIRETFADNKDLIKASRTMEAIARVCENVPKTISGVSVAVATMSEKGLIHETPAAVINKNKDDFVEWFKSVAVLIRDGIVKPIRDTFSDNKDIYKAANTLNAISKAMVNIPPTIENVAKALDMMKGGKWTSTPADKINKYIDTFGEWFTSVAVLIRDGIVIPITTTFTEPEKVNEASKMMGKIAKVCEKVPPVISNVASAVGMMTGGGWFTTPADTINKYKDTFVEWFTSIATLVNDGIVKPVIDTFCDPDQIKEAAKIMISMAKIAIAVPPTIQAIGNAVSMIEKRSSVIFAQTPADKIENNKAEFITFFAGVADLMAQGIVNPINDYFPDPALVTQAAKTMTALARIAIAVPPTIRAVSEAVSMMDSGGLLAETPADKINQNKDKFGEFFDSVAKLMLEGVVNPVNTTFPEPAIVQKAAKTMTAIAKIAEAVPPTIRGVADAVSMMDSGLISPSPADKINAAKLTFKGWFKSVAEFVRDAIVLQVNQVFEKEIDNLKKAAKIMTLLAEICAAIPVTIESVSDAMLMMQGGWITSTPADTIRKNKVKFQIWFWEIAQFVRHGIVNPITTMFPSTEELDIAKTKLDNVGKILAKLPQFIQNLANKAKEMNEKVLTASNMFNVFKFAAAFYAIADMIYYGVISPISYFPDPEEIELSMLKLEMVSLMILGAEDTMNTMIDASNRLVEKIGGFWTLFKNPIANEMFFAETFYRISNLIYDGIIDPIALFPEPEDLQITITKLELTSKIVQQAETVLDDMSTVSSNLINRVGLFWKVLGNTIANEKFFAETFYRISNLIRYGIIYPMENFPEPEELQITILKLELTSIIVKQAETVLDTMSTVSSNLINRIGLFRKVLGNTIANEKFFAETFYRISNLIRYGIIYPMENFPEPEELQITMEKLQLTEKIILFSERVMDAMSQVTNRFIKKVGYFWALLSNPAANEKLFADAFYRMAKLIYYGIIMPVMQMPEPKELEIVLEKLDFMGEIIGSAESVMNYMNEVFTRFTEKITVFEAIFGRIDQRVFQKVFMDMSGTLINGIINPILKYFPTTDELQSVVDRLDGLVQVLSETERVMNAIAETSANIGEIGIDSKALENIPVDKLLQLANKMDGGVAAPPKAPDDTMAMMIGGGLGGAMGTLAGPVGTMLGASLGGLAGKGVAMAGRGISDLLFGSAKETPTPATIPAMSTGATVQSRVAARKASDEPTTNKIASKELEDISSASTRQTELQEELVELFKKFIDMVNKPSESGSSGVDAPNTQLNRVQGKSPKYYRPTTGMAGQGPAKQITNLGPIKN